MTMLRRVRRLLSSRGKRPTGVARAPNTMIVHGLWDLVTLRAGTGAVKMTGSTVMVGGVMDNML